MTNLNSTPSAERIHIGIFGCRNAGKSSLINAVTGQNLAIVSDYKGTTTDPVYKAMELLPLGPITLIDTPGIDDEGELGAQRVRQAYKVLQKCDLALLVLDAATGITAEDKKLWQTLTERNIPSLLILNKADKLSEMQQALVTLEALKLTKNCLLVSAENGFNIDKLKENMASLKPQEKAQLLAEDLFQPLDTVILVTPIDASAPKGRLILPQQLIIRNILDNRGITLVVQPQELAQALLKLTEPPRLIITDSQVFGQVSRIVPPHIPLTSFSILMARYKGSLAQAVKAVRVLDTLKDGDKVLISEGCTHHRQCQDIGTVKMPGWVRNYCQCEPEFVFSSGGDFPEDLTPYKLIIHCGACMLNEKAMQHRNKSAQQQNVPMTNYGLAIAYMHGILQRSVAPIPEIAILLQ